MQRMATMLVAAACGLGAASAEAQVVQGPMVQAVTSAQAGIWVRTGSAQPVRIRLTDPEGNTSYTSYDTTNAASDFTASFVVTGLQAAGLYHYQVGTTNSRGVETWTGKYAFDTVSADPDRLRVAVVSDFANKLVASPSLRTAIKGRPDLLAVIGDLDHRGPGGAARPVTAYDPAAALADMRSMHRDTRDPANPIGADFYAGIIGDPGSDVPQIPWVYAWDDHDFCSNNAAKNCQVAPESFQALNEYYILAPDNWTTSACSYPADFESLTYGTLAQVFFLDARSNRVRLTTQPSNTMLGACQLRWLIDGLHASKATWKIVMSPVPLNATMKTWDAWSFFAVERAAFLAAIANVPNVVVVSGDVHTGGAVDDGTHSGLPEVSTPHANMPRDWVNTYCRLIDAFTVLQVRPGSWTYGGLVNPILGVEPIQCGSHTYPDDFPIDGLSAPVYPLDGRDNPGYVWIDASRTSLAVTVHDVNGRIKQGKDADGANHALELDFAPSH